jgi:hypothetical protein
MLNELKMLSDSIRAAGFTGVEWDDRFKEIKVKGSPCFVLSLSPVGEIADIRYLEPGKAKFLRTWQGGSLGQCFPAFNFQPFYCFEGSKLTPQQKANSIRDFASAFSSGETLPDSVGVVSKAPRGKPDAKMAKCLGSVAAKFFKIAAEGQAEDDSLSRFRKAFGCFVPDGVDIARTVNEKLWAFLRKNVTSSMLLADGDRTMGSLVFRGTGDVVVFLDLHDPSAMPLASEWGMRTVNERLLAARSSEQGKLQGQVMDAFGEWAVPAELDDKLPEVKLPGAVAVTKLRSMNAESRCQTRYGFIDAESFPVGKTIRKNAKIALTWISSPDREGQTWAIAGKEELVFAYPKRMPQTAPRLARLFGNDPKQQEARFEQYAVAALQGLKTLSAGPASDAEIEIFAIKKADKARRKIVFYRNYSVGQLETAVSKWLEGANNIPEIRLLKWPPTPKGQKAQKGTRPIPMEFHAPLPLASIGLAYTMWSQDGAANWSPPFRSALLYDKIPVFDGLELFLGDALATGLAEQLLAFLLRGSASLCAACGNVGHARGVVSHSGVVAHLETAIPLFGILLEKLNRKKETYMENAPYLIGKFLNLADGLHAVWCRNVKGKDPLPPQLLGSSFFASFQLNPVQAFGNMGLRVKPYLDWAKTNSTPDAKLSRWFLGELGRVCNTIQQAGLPARLSDADKAEMLLGYLSWTGKTDSPEDIENDPQPQGNEHE